MTPASDTREPAGSSRNVNRLLLIGSAILAPVLFLVAMATGGGWLLVLLASLLALAACSVLDPRFAFLVAVLFATFVDYNTGKLAIELAVVFAWMAGTLLLVLWRSAWMGVIQPPRAIWPGMAVWFVACALGIVHGLLRGNSMRNMGLEVAAALWPAFALAMMQVYRRASLRYATIGLVTIGLLHTAFGLFMLQVYRQRLGGIYFTTVTGVAVVVLWSVALLAPSRKTRILCLVVMVPMFVHLLFSFTRGYWLGALAGLGVVTFLSWRTLGRFEPRIRARRFLLVPAFGLAFAVAVGLSVLYAGGGDVLTAVSGRFGSSFSTQYSGETLSNLIRLDEYDHAIGAALESPLLGKGMGYSFVTKDIFTRLPRDQWFVHNYYLLLWLKLGVLGLFAFGYLLWTFVRAAGRAAFEDPSWLARAWAIAAIAVTIQVAVILLTNYSLADVNTAAIFAFVWGIFWSTQTDPSGAPAIAEPSPGPYDPDECSPRTARSS